MLGEAGAQSVSLLPDRLREGDGRTRNITLDANVAPGSQLGIAVSYRSDPAAPGNTFIPKFSVQDNASDDRNPQDGKIRLVLPKAFDKTGVYIIEVDEPQVSLSLKLVHEPNNTSYVRQFVDWLVTAAGGGERDPNRKSVLERIEELTKNNGQGKVAIWTAPMPAAGQEIKPESLKLSIRSALTPSWARNGNFLVCSAWRNGKWILAAYRINRGGTATQLWEWSPGNVGVSDFSPAWSPNGDTVAFVRFNQDRKSDIWLLELDRNRRPKKERKVTNFGNVQAISGWHKDLGILFETKTHLEGRPSIRHVWAINASAPNGQPAPLPDEFRLVRGSAPLRRSIFYIEEKDGPPMSAFYEVNSNGKLPILFEESCSHRWLTVSHDERWLAFDSNCPR